MINNNDIIIALEPKDVLVELAQQCIEDSERWFGDSGKIYDIAHHALGLGGETGEVLEIIKKIDRGSKNLDDPAVREHLVEELVDVFIYLLNIAGILKADLLAAYNVKRQYNEQRFIRQRAERELDKYV